jgi:hypothetical protein
MPLGQETGGSLRTARLRLIWIAGADMAVVEAMRSRVFRLSDLAHDTSTDRPQSVGNRDWIDIALFPPRDFIADLVVLVVVIPAQRNHEFVAGFAPQRSWLSKAKVMGIGRGAPTQQTRLQRHKSQVGFIPTAAELAKLEHALVDLDDARCVQVSR